MTINDFHILMDDLIHCQQCQEDHVQSLLDDQLMLPTK